LTGAAEDFSLDGYVEDVEGDDEAMFPTTAPIAVADMRQYFVLSAAICWVKVGESYRSDGRQTQNAASLQMTKIGRSGVK
jgi:hypothetical protein